MRFSGNGRRHKRDGCKLRHSAPVKFMLHHLPQGQDAMIDHKNCVMIPGNFFNGFR